MKFMKTIRLPLIVLILLVLFSLPAGAFGTGSEGHVYYNPTKAVYPTMNINTHSSSSFWSGHVGSDNNSVYNIAPAFKKNSSSRGASSMPDYLNFGTSFQHKNNDNTYWVYYQYYFENALKAAANKGDLSVSFLANLKNDKHWNYEQHLSNKTAYPTTYLSASNKRLIEHDTGSKHYDTTLTMGGKNDFVPIGTYPWDNEMRFVAYGNTCTCGSSKVSNISIMLADLAGPKVKSIYTTRLKSGETMEPYTEFKADNELYINLKFDENIRFADDQAMALESAPKLKLKVKRITDNIQETGVSVEASLVSLDKDTLTFKYVVPKTYSLAGQTVNANYYIYEVEPYANQTSWVSSSQNFNLKLLGKNATHLGSSQKATSKIVDLAGNPISLASKVTLDAPVYMDNVVPEVRKLEIVRTTKTDPTQMSRSDVFAKVGEKLGFFVYFTEEMYFVRKSDNTCLEPEWYCYYDEAKTKLGINMREPFFDDPSIPISILVDLNIGKSGTPVTAVAKYMIYINDGLNGPKVSKVYFEMDNSSISTDMAPIIYNDKQLPIGINKIYMTTGKDVYALSDARGNLYNEGLELINATDGDLLMPDQQLWLDVVAPTATTTLTSSAISYAPMGYGDGNTATFCFPVTVSDQIGHGEEYKSQTNGVTGLFKWRDNTGSGVDYAYEYVVTGSADKPADSDYKSGVTGQQLSFSQIDSGNYIHIRLLDEVAYNIGDSDIVIYPIDNAGNVGEVAFALDYQMDRTGPKIIRDQFKQQYDAPSNAGRIDAYISLWDFNMISGIEYQWTNLGEDPIEDNWTVISTYDVISIDPYKRVEVTISRGSLGANVKHCYTLHARSTDSLGFTSTGNFNFEYDLTLPKFNLEFVTDPSQPLAKHSLKVFMPETRSSSPVVANYVMLMVRKKLSNGTYADRALFRCSFSSLFYSNSILKGPDNAWELLEIGSNPKADGWVAATPVHVTDPADIEYIAYGGPFTDYPFYYNIWNDEIALLDEMFNKTYGQVEITLMSRRIDGNGKEGYIKDTELYSKDTYTFNYANASKIGPNEKIHNAIIAPTSPVSCGVYWRLKEEAYLLRADLPAVPRSLDGKVFNVTLSNTRVAAYGLLDIDFDSPDTYFALYKTGAGESNVPLFTAPLIPMTSQDIAVPAGVATATGTYKVVVSIKCKNSEHIDKIEYTNIMIDKREIDTYGVTEVKTNWTIENGTVSLPSETVTSYDISSESRPTEIFVSAQSNVTQSILFQTNLQSLTFGSESDYTAYIKVWNKTLADGNWISYSRYRWIPLAGQRLYKTEVLTPITRSQITSNLTSSVPDNSALIPLMPGENIINYQIFTTSGYETPVQTLIVRAGNNMPTIEMTLSPEKKAGTTTNGDVVATIKALGSLVVSPDTLQVGLAFPSGVVHEGNLIADFKANRQVTLTENGVYYFYVFDKYHNYGYQKVTIDYIDREGPSLVVKNNSDALKNTFNFEATIADTFNIENCKLYIGFDDAYCSVLGVNPGAEFEVNTKESWSANDISQNGIYATSVTAGSGGAKVISISGVFKYDKSVGATVNRTFTIYAVDGSGNKSGQWVVDPVSGKKQWQEYQYTVTLSTRNEPTALVSGELEDGSFAATFNKPVLLTMPNENTLTPAYNYKKGNMPFYNNGVYPIKCSDIFGDIYEGNVTVDQYDALYNCTVSISETAPTNKNVQVLINASFNTNITLELPVSIPGAIVEKVYDGQGAVVGASITMTKNGTISYGLKPKDSTFATQMRSILVGNIDKIMPVVGLKWVYTSGVTKGLTAGEVIVSLETNKTIQSLQDSSTTHTFTLDDQTPYTFHFADLAGNGGSITATLPVEIIEKTRVELDITPPNYELSVYQNNNGMSSTKAAGYNRLEYEALPNKADAFPLFSGVLRLCFEISDENQTSLSIKESNVPGVTVKGTTVTVSANADFTIVITDANNNMTEVPISITKADNTSPLGAVTYVKTGAYSIRGYLNMSDDHSEGVTIKNTSGILLETTAGEYHGKYYHDFLDNESFTFLFSDKAGNNGSVIAAVTTLDMSSPTGIISQWVPYYIDGNGVEHKGQLTNIITNSDVSVYIQFSKPIKTITPSILDTKGSLQDISVTQTEDNATVVFKQNAKVKLAFMALNGKSGSTVLDVDIIDKVPPVITSDWTTNGARSVTYTYTSNEQVFFEDGENVTVSGISFTKDYELNGDYYSKFTDKAGNSTTVKITISGIDRVAPSIGIEDLPATKENVKTFNEVNGTSYEHKMTNASVIIKASTNEAGIITFQGTSYSVTAYQQVPITIDYNGTYELIATDQVGMITRYQFRIDCIDKSRPQIQLPGGNLLIKQGTSVAAFETKALEKVIVSDNYDKNLTATLSTSLTDSQLNTPGTYSIVFTAKDSAGNQHTATYFARVYAKNSLEVLVNETLAQPGETLFVGCKGDRIINVIVNNLPASTGGNEPFKMYLKSGLNTPGQMKNADSFSDDFIASKDGFYTLYIITQSKVSFISYIYVQQTEVPK